MRTYYVPTVGDWVRYDYREWRVEEILEDGEPTPFSEIALVGDDGDEMVVSASQVEYTGVNL